MNRMLTRKRVIGWGVVLLLVAVLVGAALYINPLLPIITGYNAKHLCSSVFISNRTQKSVEELDLNFFPVKYASNDVNFTDSTVTSRFLWGKSVAVFRKGTGSVLVREASIEVVKRQTFTNRFNLNADTAMWPMGNRMARFDDVGLQNRVAAIGGNVMNGKRYGGHIFAFLVMHRGEVVAEKYGVGINSSTRLLGWSMAKSFTNALVGSLVAAGIADISKPTGLKEWQNDARRKITVNDLLRMQSGLEWNENYGTRSDVTQMLYCHGNAAKYAIGKPLQYPIATKWSYSSGSTNIACYWARQQFKSDSALYAFAYSNLFNRIGMQNAILESDESGVPVGSSYIYATARDYARFALLYLQDGVFNGQQILPKGWVKYTATTTACSEGAYGASFWKLGKKRTEALPSDFMSCEGHDGQYIVMIPSEQLAIVVLGYSPRSSNELNIGLLVKDVLNAL